MGLIGPATAAPDGLLPQAVAHAPRAGVSTLLKQAQGYAVPPAPLDLLTLFHVLVLLASFIATGRRGMLAPR